ncbi:MAG TPA: cation diffusion facilitator family transporter [Ktedonobacterales bacterium]
MVSDGAVSQTGTRHAGAHAGHTHALTRQALRLGFMLTAAMLLIELIGGLASHSLALLSDAAHVLTDVVALGLAWFAAAQAERPANERRTYGYHRVGIVVALANGLTLIAIAIAVTVEAWQRLHAPEAVQPGIMIAAAAIAVAVNLYIISRLHGDSDNLNARASMLHALGDVGASVAVVIGAVIIAMTGATWVDPIISVAIAVLIAFGAARLIREAGDILLESTPRDVSTPAVARDICAVPGIRAVHDLHIWQITAGLRALSCHAVIADIPPSESAAILDQVSDMLRQRYRISHTTIQLESDLHEAHDGFCACDPGMADSLYCDMTPDQRPREHSHSGHSHSAGHSHA